MTAEQRSAAVFAGAELVKIVHGTVAGMRKAQSDRISSSPLRLVPGASQVTDVVDQSMTIAEQSVAATVAAVAEIVAPIVRWGTPTDAAPMDTSVRGGAVLAAIGAAVGDSLAEEAHTRALVPELSLRQDGRVIAPADFVESHQDSAETLVVFLHGLGCTELNWSNEVLAAVGSAVPVLVRYPTGSAVTDNGEALAAMMEQLLPGLPQCQRIVFVGHSMGGLVAWRAMEVSAALSERVSDLITLGTPHGGSPIEKGAQAALMVLNAFSATKPLASLGHRRSAGIKDLRHGAIRVEDWAGRDPDTALRDRSLLRPLPPHITHHAVVAIWPEPADDWKGSLIGDGAVRRASAEAQEHSESHPEFQPKITVLESSSHLSLIGHPDVADLIAKVLGDSRN